MARLLALVLVAVVLVGGVVWLARRDASQPVTRIEKTVTVDAPAR